MIHKFCKHCKLDCWHNPLPRNKLPSSPQEYRCTNCGYPYRIGATSKNTGKVGNRIMTFFGGNPR